MSSMRILRRIRKEFDYEAYAGEHFTIKRTARPDEIRICCPSCGDSKFKCYINNDKKRFNCFKCDFNSGNYDVFDFVSLAEAIPRGIAIKKLAQEFAPTTPLTMEEVVAKLQGHIMEVDEDEPGEPSDIKTISSLPEGAFPLTSPTVDTEGPFWTYLKNERGLTEKEVLSAHVHFVPQKSVEIQNEVGKYVGDIGRRIVFPVYGPNGSLVSWISRSIGPTSGPRYINCPGSEINRTLWPFVEPYVKSVILTEGILDCISVRRLGKPFSAYATFGKKVSYDQIKHLKDWGVEEVILFWDPDAKGDVIRAVEDLKMHFTVFVPDMSLWPVGYDPGDMMKEESGIISIEQAVCNPVDVDSVEFSLWQI